MLNLKLFAQFSQETGFFPITNFKQEDYNNALAKNSAIVQDKRGIMYFGNDEGILEYDGIRWKLYYVANETPVQSLAIDKNGRIYVGAVDEFGYLLPNEYGELKYVSLLEYLDDSLKNFKEIWYIYATDHGVYFQSTEYIFLWNNNKISYWKASNCNFHTSFLIKNRLIVNKSGEGLFKIENEKLIKIEKSDYFKDKAIFSMIPLKDNSFFTVTKNSGLYRVIFNSSFDKIDILPISRNLNETFKEYFLYNAVKISDNTYSIGTWGSGLLIYQNGSIVKLITRESGINNEVIVNQYLDKDNNLWLALSEGITKIEINSPLTKFNEQLGIEGSIESITRFNDNIYIASEKGLLFLPELLAKSKEIYNQNMFLKLEKFQGGCWDVLSYNNKNESFLLVAIDDGILQIDKSNQIKRICDCSPWKLYKSKYKENLIYIGLDDGLATLERINEKWSFKQDYNEITEKVFNITEDNNGDLWLGTLFQGIIKIENPLIFDNRKIYRFNERNGLPANSQVYICNYQNKILFGADHDIYTLNEKKTQ